jgi:uncharacterized protein YkwD
MAMRTVSKTVNSGSSPGSPARLPRPGASQLTSARMARAWTAPAGTRAGAGAALALLTLAISLALAASPGTTAALAGCPHADARAHKTSLANLRDAMRCLVNNKRDRHDLRTLDENGRLNTAAKRHTKVMLRRDCFKHRCADEPALRKRIRQSGYLQGANAFEFAEDLGFDRTPRRLIKRLMNSAYNRRQILGKDWKDIGVGVGWGAPRKGRNDSKYATYTIVFAWRRP